MHAISYPLKLHIDRVILDGHGQAYPSMLKEAFGTYMSKTIQGQKSIDLF